MTMVLIPKLSKDRTRVKRWRPMDTVGKLGEKVMADRLQRHTVLFHHLQYGSRTNRSATDTMMIMTSITPKETERGNIVTKLGKDMVSAFNNLRKSRLLALFCDNNLEKEMEFCRDFLHTKEFQISWDMEERGKTMMDDSTLQGSPLSPILWLIYIGSTLKRAERRCDNIVPSLRRVSPKLPNPPVRTISVFLINYADDFNLVIVTKACSVQEKRKVSEEVDRILEEEGAADDLTWDPAKASGIEFGRGKDSTTTLGIRITSSLSWKEHINIRTEKAKKIFKIMTRLGNSNGGISPAAMRNLYTGMVRPIFTWGAELWNGPHTNTNITEMERIE